MLEAYQKHVSHYMALEPDRANQEQLKKAYKKINLLYNQIDKLQPKVYQNPPPLPPKPLTPEQKIEKKIKVETKPQLQP